MKKIFLSIVVLISLQAEADVNLSNGNFYFSIIDYLNANNSLLKIERVYNSRNLFNGLFGIGWSSNFETNLKISASGELLVREYGGGTSSYYINDDDKKNYKTNIKQNLNLVAALMSKYSFSLIPERVLIDTYEKDREKLERDYEFLVSNSKIGYPTLPTGKTYYSGGKKFEYIVKTGTGYVRYTDDGNTEFYKNNGQLFQSENGNNTIFISYNNKNQISQISDSKKVLLKFEYDSFEKVKKITEANLSCEYYYNRAGENIILSNSKNEKGGTFVYQYNDRAFLTKVDQGTTPIFLVTYNLENSLPREVTVNDSLYIYEFEPSEIPNLFTHAKVKIFDSTGKGKHLIEQYYKYKESMYSHFDLVEDTFIDNGNTRKTKRSFHPDGNGFFDEKTEIIESSANGNYKGHQKTKFKIKTSKP